LPTFNHVLLAVICLVTRRGGLACEEMSQTARVLIEDFHTNCVFIILNLYDFGKSSYLSKMTIRSMGIVSMS
jgi:hypothetical protein